MKPAPFNYAAARTVGDAIDLLGQYGKSCRVLAGGQSLMAMMNLRTVRPSVIIDIGRLQELANWSERNGEITIGAMVRQGQLEADKKLQAAIPLFALAIHNVGHAATRSRGTIVGSLCHADPAAELPVCAVAMNARLVLQSIRGERLVSAEEFFTGIFSTAADEDELVTAVCVPRLPSEAAFAFEELARRHGDFAMASAACVLKFDDKGRVSEARIVFGGVGDRPFRGTGGEQVLTGTKPQEMEIVAAAKAATADLSPYDDIHATSDYRKTVSRVLAERVLRRALASQTRNQE